MQSGRSLGTAGRAYARHPKTLRWKGKLKALFYRHEALTSEMCVRGFRHFNPLAEKQATGQRRQTMSVDSPRQQVMMLKKKRCHCDV